MIDFAGNMDASDIVDDSNVSIVAKLLGSKRDHLKDALTTKTIFAQGDSVVRFIISYFGIILCSSRNFPGIFRLPLLRGNSLK